MTSPTREEIIRAHETLNDLCDCLRMGWRVSPANIKDSKDAIKKALPPLPRSTMAEIRWDDDMHFLAEAKNDIGISFLMLKKHDIGNIKCVVYPSFETRIVRADALTPTGKRYTLTEVQE